MNYLEDMLSLQRILQTYSFGTDPCNLETDADRSEFAFKSIVMLQDEAHEALGEVSWKWWASEKFFNEEEFKGEVIDMIHFVLNLALVSGMDSEEIYNRYREKNMKNRVRQEVGYGGVTDKCQICHAHVSEGCSHTKTE